MPHLHIHLDRRGYGTVTLDGRQLDHVSSIGLYLEAGETNRAEIRLIGAEVDVRLDDAEVTIERVTYPRWKA